MAGGERIRGLRALSDLHLDPGDRDVDALDGGRGLAVHRGATR